MQRIFSKVLIAGTLYASLSCGKPPFQPADVEFQSETLKRVELRGDNWCTTWASDGSQITSMDDGNWLGGSTDYSNHLYRIKGEAGNFTREDIPNYPQFKYEEMGWFGYGMGSIGGTLYSFVSKCPRNLWSGPFQGSKLLKSPDNGKTWYRVDKSGNELLLNPETDVRNDTTASEFFFGRESAKSGHGGNAYPFSFNDFVQEGQDHQASPDGYVYIYSPEGALSNQLLLARVKAEELENRDRWEYFSGWDSDKPSWNSDLAMRKPFHEFPEKNQKGEYFGWYSWLPSVVWNPGLKLYVMVNGGTYAGRGLTDDAKDYYDAWMHSRTGSLGLWYAEKPYGPWKQFYYTDYWTADNPGNLTYQPKLSPKWISDDGRSMTLIWSDAMKNEAGKSHSIRYMWNQMQIKIK